MSGPVVIAPGATKDKHCFLGEVIASTIAAITVRDRRDERRIRTFTYSPNLAAKMAGIVAKGNFQPGDKVEISCRVGRNEAYAIKDNPSVPRWGRLVPAPPVTASSFPLRQPAVAGKFYPRNPSELATMVDGFSFRGPSAGNFLNNTGADATTTRTRTTAQACLVPHAGYIYSGRVAGAVYGTVKIPSRVILIGPRHYPIGEDLAVVSSGKWLTPLGEATIDIPLAQELKRACHSLREDELAHRREHSLEVQLPFLQRARPDFTFVPIVLGTDRWEALENIGHALAAVISAQHEPVLLIASSDMNHYEPDDITRVKDNVAIERLLALDARGLFDTVRRERISMCGYSPTVCTLIAARELGTHHAELVRYATSGDVNGDREQVVGYAGMIFHG